MAKGDGLIKVTFFITRKDGVSAEAFHEYWSQRHAQAFLSVPIIRKNVVKYSQFHADSSVDLAKFGVGVASYDGVASVWARSLDELAAVYTDAEYLKAVIPDEEKYFDRGKVVTMVGWDEDKWENGKVL
ncbi:hypothetical protein GGS23DRAFT_594194 [Durotheca rogersii]|uniref:uncharacterized protein n=1 Tax=Durotheca rogersii TaxID=419775 RepID=UPI00221EBF46|nr:uncharacterized protein GGS23DRAFT_594194 [Durotheca rogersii]KAI5866040.1 hypothetical protein GGS23DRAFT_594194 [Durotheca rogersii]